MGGETGVRGQSGEDILASRRCGDCTLCCKVYRVPEVEKPAGVLCRHCIPGTGCGLYPAWPSVCQTYFCLWREEASLDDSWQPHIAGFVLTPHESGNLAVDVDPDRPGIWRRAPYEAQFRQWAGDHLDDFRHVVVHTAGHAVLILPDRDIEVGFVGRDEEVVFIHARGPDGALEVTAEVRKRANPAENA